MPAQASPLWTLLLFTMSVVETLPLSAHQQPPASDKRPSKPTVRESGNASRFTCPDPDAKKACDSFLELRNAGDDAVQASVGDRGIAYVCFRSPEDQFFIVSFHGPIYAKRHFDPKTKQFVPDDEASDDVAHGFLTAFVNGILDGAAIPLHFVRGTWTHFLDSDTFAASLVDGKAADNDSFAFGIDSSQVFASMRYQNRFEKDVDYRLVIQRSTGRFSEDYTTVGEKLPFSQRNGRCSNIAGAPR